MLFACGPFQPSLVLTSAARALDDLPLAAVLRHHLWPGRHAWVQILAETVFDPKTLV